MSVFISHRYNNFISLLLLIIVFSCSDSRREELVRIKYESAGCFGSEKSQLSIIGEKDRYKAKLETQGMETSEVYIDENDLQAVFAFVNELKAVTTGNLCTTIQSCFVSIDYERVKKEKIDCSWNGFTKLRQILFPLEAGSH